MRGSTRIGVQGCGGRAMVYLTRVRDGQALQRAEQEEAAARALSQAAVTVQVMMMARGGGGLVRQEGLFAKRGGVMLRHAPAPLPDLLTPPPLSLLRAGAIRVAQAAAPGGAQHAARASRQPKAQVTLERPAAVLQQIASSSEAGPRSTPQAQPRRARPYSRPPWFPLSESLRVSPSLFLVSQAAPGPIGL